MAHPADSKERTVLVTGASGFIGSALVRALRGKGIRTRCLIRKDSRSGHLKAEGAELAIGDMRDPKSLLSAVKGVDAVFHLAASTSEKAHAAEESRKTNVDGASFLIEACRKQGVRRLIVVSTQSAKRKRQGLYGSTKLEADKRFMASGLDWTLLRPTLVYGPGSKGLFAKISKLITALPVIPLIGSGDYRLQPTPIADLISALLSVLDTPQTIGKVYDIAGATRMRFVEMVRIISSTAQKEKRIVPVPFWLCALGVRSLSLLTRNPPITMDNLLGLIQETSLDLTPAKKDFGYSPTPFREGIWEAFWGKDSSAVQIGLIGCGKMGLLHASLVQAMDHAKVVALFDVKDLRSSFHGLNIRAPFYTSLDAFFSRQRIDAAFISVPPAFTLPMARECAKRRIPFLVEKPLADSLEHAEEIVRLGNGLPASVGYMYAFSPLLAKAQELLPCIGSLVSVRGEALVTQVLSRKKGWRYSKASAGGGCVSLHGSHLFSLLSFLLGLPRSAKARLSFPFSEVEDTADVELAYPGFSATCRISWSEPGHPKLDLSLTLTGTNGSLSFTPERIVLTEHGTSRTFPKEAFPFPSFELGGELYFSQDEAFIQGLREKRGKRRPRVSLRDGLAIQRMVDAVYRSHEKGREVSL